MRRLLFVFTFFTSMVFATNLSVVGGVDMSGVVGNTEFYIEGNKNPVRYIVLESSSAGNLNAGDIIVEVRGDVTADYLQFYVNSAYGNGTDGNVTFKFVENLNATDGAFLVGTKARPNSILGGGIFELIPYRNGLIHGKKVFDNTRLNIKVEYEYENGKMNGVEKHYSRGNLESTKSYVDGFEQGIAYEYTYNGTIRSETPYNKGKIDGRQKHYFFKDTTKATIQSDYKKGVLQKSIYFYENGNIKKESFYNGNINPELNNEYYENGNIKSISNERKDGSDSISYYINGNIEAEYVFKDNRRSKVKRYDENKNLIYIEEATRLGKRVKAYYSNGQLKIDETYSKIGYVGTHRYFNEDGSLVCEINYENDKAISGKYGSGKPLDQKDIHSFNNYGNIFGCALMP